jgi:hypothetical protein
MKTARVFDGAAESSETASDVLADALQDRPLEPVVRASSRLPRVRSAAVQMALAPVASDSDVAFEIEMIGAASPAPPDVVEIGDDASVLGERIPMDLEFDLAISADGQRAPHGEVAGELQPDDLVGEQHAAETAPHSPHDLEFDLEMSSQVASAMPLPPVDDTSELHGVDEDDVADSSMHDVSFDVEMHGAKHKKNDADDAVGELPAIEPPVEEENVGAAPIALLPPHENAPPEEKSVDSDVAFDMELIGSAPKEGTDPYKVPTWSQILGDKLDKLDREINEQDLSVLGDLVQKSRAFAKYAQQRIAASKPVLRNEKPLIKARDWQVDFGPAWAPAGYTTTIRSILQVPFRGEKVFATDSWSPPGTGTRIMQVMVGQREQRAGNGGNATLTAFYANNSLGNGIKWDTCQRALSINVTVSFMQSCTFDMIVFGRAIL